jgi:uncharacterized protein (TIGR03437 family)
VDLRPSRILVLFVLLLLEVLGRKITAQTWSALAPSGNAPSPRADASAIYDGNTNRMVIFGGSTTGCTFSPNVNDTWVLINANGLGGPPEWQQLHPSGGPPPVRRGHSAVYNPTSNRMVIFGGDPVGCAVSKYSDVWVLSNATGVRGQATWTQLFPTGGPPPGRSDHTAVYDQANNRMTVYGGFGPTGNLHDVWVLTNADGTGGTPQWNQLTPSGGPPSASSLYAGVYDSASNRMIISGGGNCCTFPTALFEVWVLTNANGLNGGSQFLKLSISGVTPSPRFDLTGVYIGSSNKMITLGGASNSGVQNEVWVLANANGIGNLPNFVEDSFSGTLPPPRGGVVGTPSVVLDPGSNRIITFGGGTPNGLTNDVWVLANADSNGPLSIETPPSLQSGVIGSAYSAALAANGGTPPYTWSLAAGTPPTGLTLSGSGSLTGTPTVVGTVDFTVTVTDSSGNSATQTFNMTVGNPAISQLTITTPPNLPSGAIDLPYSVPITAIGGTPPYTWSVTAGGPPNGLMLSSAGSLSGIPIAQGSVNFTVKVIDSAGQFATEVVDIAISTPQIFATPPNLTFAATEGDTEVQGQPLLISAPVQGLNYSIGGITDNWLSVAPTQGTLPMVLSVFVSPGLPPGVYESEITVSVPGYPNTEIPITFQVSSPGSVAFDLQAPPMLFTVSSSSQSTTPPIQIVLVKNLSGQSLNVRMTSRNGSPWLNISPQQTTIGSGQTVNVTVQVIPNLLPSGPVQTDSLIVTGAGEMEQLPLVVSVVSNLPPILSAYALTLFTLQGQNNLDESDVQVFNPGPEPLEWIATPTDVTIQISPTFDPDLAPNGTPDTVEISTTQNVAGLVPPSATTHVKFDFGILPETDVPVTIVISNGSNLPPRPNTAGVLLGLPGQPQQIVTLTSSDSVPDEFIIKQKPDWVSVIAPSNQIPAGPGTSIDLTVSAIGQGLQLGEEGTFTVEFPNYFGKPLDLLIGVAYVGTSSTSSSADTSNSSARAATGVCEPTQLVAVFSSPGNLFEVPAALPTKVEARVADDCGNPVTSGAAVVTFSTNEPAIALAPFPGGIWRGTWQPVASSSGLVTLQLAAARPGVALPAQAIVFGTIGSPGAAPIVLNNSVVNSATEQTTANTVAPGQFMSIFGHNLADKVATAEDGIPKTTLGGVQVLFGGSFLPLFYVSPSQINTVLPFGVPAQYAFQLIVQRDGIPSVPLLLTVVPAQPGIFAADSSGSGQGVILGPANRLADAANPVSGGDVISIYCTGLGALDQPVNVATPAPAQEPLARVSAEVGVLIGGIKADVLFAGLAPGLFDLYQVKVQVPVKVPVGDNIPVQIGIGNLMSNEVTLAIR